MPNEDVCAELGQVRDALQHVAVSIEGLVPRGELDRASTAVVEDNRRWRRSIALLIIGGPVLFLMNAAILWQGHNREISFRRDVRQGVSCLLGDVSSHRRDQRGFEVAISQKLNAPFTLGPATLIPQDDLDALTKQCSIVLQRFLSLSFGAGGLPNQAGGTR